MTQLPAAQACVATLRAILADIQPSTTAVGRHIEEAERRADEIEAELRSAAEAERRA